MSDYIAAQICQVKAFLKNFERACELGAKEHNGKIDKAEAKELKRIHKAVKKFADELDRI